jgi:D-lactate dehydrogenase
MHNICIAHDLSSLGLSTGRIFSHGFRANVVGYDPYPNEAAAAENGIKYVPLDELFRTSDIISLHCPLTPQTKYIVNEEVLRTTKPGNQYSISLFQAAQRNNPS